MQDEDKNVLMEFSMTPLDKGESVSFFVSRSLDIIDSCGLDYQLNPMGTVVEGNWKQIMDVLGKCYKRMAEDCNRISISIKMDCRGGKEGRLKSKISSIEKHLGREIKK